MDKFNELVTMLEEIISRIDGKIERKTEELSKLNDKIDETRDTKSKKESSMLELQGILEILEPIENKGILITIIKDTIKEIKTSYKSFNGFQKKIILVLLFLVAVLLASLIIFEPTIGSIISMGFLAVFIGPTIIIKVEEIIKARKKYTLAEAREEIESLEKQISELTKEEELLYKKQGEVERTQSDLTKEKIIYFEDLTRVKQEQSAAIERLISPEVLNAEFNEQTFGDIIRRVREIQKKEGKK